MGNYCCCFHKRLPDSPHCYHYTPKFKKSPSKIVTPIIKKSPKLKCKKCKHCNQNFFKYSPQIFCSNECRLMKKQDFLTEN